MKQAAQACVAAFQFLSRLPLPIQIHYSKEVFARSVVFYPLVGAVLGGLVWGFGYGSSLLFPLVLAAVLTLVWTVSLTGALHIDGLMDTADGILSHRPREQMLEIMKDSRVGAMGVIVCVLAMLLKAVIFYTLLDQKWSWEIVLPFIWSRWFMVIGMAAFPYARKESGLGSYFKGVGARHVTGATLMAVVVSVLIWIGTAMWGGIGTITTSDGLSIVWIGMGALLLGMIIARSMANKLGGLTGDTYGALNECLEILLLLICTIIV
ncbi:adenosylcobinamide-GDP ribazoletransferase [Paenibacillus sp. GCM10027629]|uniref:adenosylcobinamide-GDP ribazoletransferase n=1 Tax=Paenibacillus sp. GCM10027629 TaxID=3273414 RepID=UPI003638E18E